jgi:hypothetical protein
MWTGLLLTKKVIFTVRGYNVPVARAIPRGFNEQINGQELRSFLHRNGYFQPLQHFRKLGTEL